MAERDDRMARDAREAQSGQRERSASEGDRSERDRSELDRSLQRGSERLVGDLDSNRNLTGSTTYETLREQGDLDVEEVEPRDGSGRPRNKGSGDSPGSSSDGMR
ncbi:MAG: hypothetical protein JO180_04100 [Gemmatirosa sp.]|nr:hypothetical protein [Gemmatirosa sp.]